MIHGQDGIEIVPLEEDRLKLRPCRQAHKAAVHAPGREPVLDLTVIAEQELVINARAVMRERAQNAPHVQAMTIAGIRVFAPAFLLMGFNMFTSSMFTAFNDGKTSAIISLLRSLVFLIIPLLILPRIWGVDGVWASMPLAELLAVAVSVYYFRRKKSVYYYA